MRRFLGVVIEADGEEGGHWVTIDGKPVFLSGPPILRGKQVLEYGERENRRRSQWKSEWRDAARWYTGSVYMALNAGLRAGTGLKSSQQEKVRDLDELFDSAYGKVVEPVVVKRLVDGKHPLAKMVKAGRLKAGHMFMDDGYMSTTIDDDSFSGDEVFDEYILMIRVGRGVRGVYLGGPSGEDGTGALYSMWEAEAEMLLDRGTELKVVGVHENKIICEVVKQRV